MDTHEGSSRHFFIALSMVAMLLLPALSHAASNTVSYQGVLVDSNGDAVPDGNYEVQLRIFAAVTGGSPLWSETHPSVPVSAGVFSIELGVTTPFNDLFVNNALLFMEVRADIDGNLETYSPRAVITAAPYALRAEYADTVQDVSLSGILDLVEESYMGAGQISTVSGGSANTATGVASTVGGGNANQATAFRATVGGGGGNVASGEDSTVSGGVSNEAIGEASTVSGGSANDATGNGSTVGGGIFNVASGANSTVGGGALNEASGNSSTVPGGEANVAGGRSSFAAGDRCEANDDYSTAMGRGAIVNAQGSFFWRDSTTFPNLALGFDNVFAALASTGVFFFTSTDALTGVFVAGGSGTWTSLSDKNRKKDFESIDVDEVLDKVAGMPITEWTYLTEDGVRHLGPTSQDFYAAFGLGIDDKGIATLDGNGVALAAIQGLHARNNALQERIAEKEAALSRVERELKELRALVDSLITND